MSDLAALDLVIRWKQTGTGAAGALGSPLEARRGLSPDSDPAGTLISDFQPQNCEKKDPLLQPPGLLWEVEKTGQVFRPEFWKGSLRFEFQLWGGGSTGEGGSMADGAAGGIRMNPDSRLNRGPSPSSCLTSRDTQLPQTTCFEGSGDFGSRRAF